jgi:hypothetical protein
LKQLLSCTHEAEWTPFQTHYFSENLVALGIEPGPLAVRPHRRSKCIEKLESFLMSNQTVQVKGSNNYPNHYIKTDVRSTGDECVHLIATPARTVSRLASAVREKE